LNNVNVYVNEVLNSLSCLSYYFVENVSEFIHFIRFHLIRFC
jgi:hypothetical protein